LADFPGIFTLILAVSGLILWVWYATSERFACRRGLASPAFVIDWSGLARLLLALVRRRRLEPEV